MRCFRSVVLTIVFFGSIVSAQSQPASPEGGTPQKPKPAGGPTRLRIVRCDAQIGKVCVLSLTRLERDEINPHKHYVIGVKKGHYVVWISDKEEDFKLGRFQRVQCTDETKRIQEPDAADPFDKTFENDQFETIKYAKVIGTVGNCYKHDIIRKSGAKTDPHIIIETGP